MRIERAELRDLPDVLELLQQSALSTDGVRDHIQTMVLARDGGRIVGSAGLEVYADGALLRSVDNGRPIFPAVRVRANPARRRPRLRSGVGRVSVRVPFVRDRDAP